MKSTTAILAMMAALGGAAGLTQMTNAQSSGATASQATAAARGAKAWADNCASCHNARSPLEKSDAQWAVAVTHMRVRANIPGDVANDILLFLQASNDAPGPISPAPPASSAPLTSAAAIATSSPVVAGNIENGARIYGETCVACHGSNGKGAIAGVPDLSVRLKKPDDVLFKNVAEGFQSPGSPMPMPARGGNPDLSDQDLADVLAYIRKDFAR